MRVTETSLTMQQAAHYRRRVHSLFTSKRRSPIECTFSVPPPDGKGTFGFRRIRENHYEITFPPKTKAWTADPVIREKLVRYLTAARLGIRLERAVLLPDSWIFTALSQPWGEEISGLSHEQRFPGAYAMLAHGFYVKPEQILRNPVSPEDGAFYILYSEWSRILFDLCLRNKLFLHGAGEAYLRRLAAKPAIDQYSLFYEIFVQALAGENYDPLKNGAFDLDQWFMDSSQRMILSVFSPAHPGLVEEKLHRILGIGLENSIDALFRTDKKMDLKDQIKISKAISSLERLSQIAPGRMRFDIQRFIPILEILRKLGKTESNSIEYNKALTDFSLSASQQNAVLKMLRAAEREMVTPGARYFLTLSSKATLDLKEPEMLRAAEKMLNSYEQAEK